MATSGRASRGDPESAVSAVPQFDALDEVFLNLTPPREDMKRKYGVDFLISARPLSDTGGATTEEFLQMDRNGNLKGILLIDFG